MSIEQMRSKVKEAYQGDKWKQKVSKMSDNQVLAIYRRFLDSKKVS